MRQADDLSGSLFISKMGLFENLHERGTSLIDKARMRVRCAVAVFFTIVYCFYH